MKLILENWRGYLEEGASVTSEINSIPMYRGVKGSNPETLSSNPGYFISNELFARTYGNTAEFKLNIKNPKVVDNRTWLDTYTNTGLIMNPDAIGILEDEGYDSVVMVADTPSGMKLYTVLVLNPLESICSETPT